MVRSDVGMKVFDFWKHRIHGYSEGRRFKVFEVDHREEWEVERV
jgi:hypothetical protein